MPVSFSIPKVIDKLLDSNPAPALVVPSLVCGFLLCLFSTAAHCGYLIDEQTNKQIGFLFAPNWVIVYMVLFPLYLYCFSTVASLRHDMIRDFVEKRFITGSDGKRVSREVVERAWDNWHNSNARIYAVLLVGVIVSSGYQWYTETYAPFATGVSPESPPDWGNFFYRYGPAPYSTVKIFVFSTICYIYMAFALLVYLGLLLYAALVGYFLRNISFHEGEFRLIYHNTDVSRHFNGFLRHVFLAVFLGLCAAYAMRLEALYLNSDYARVDPFMFSEYFTRGYGFAPTDTPNYSVGTSLGVAVYTLILGGITGGTLWAASANSRTYYLTRIGDPDWRRSANLGYDQALVDLIAAQRFWTVIRKKYSRMVASIVFLCLAIAFARYGTLFLASLILAIHAAFTVRDEPVMATVQRTDADRPIAMNAENKMKLERLLTAHVAFNGGRSFLEGVISGAHIPEPYKINIIAKLQSADDIVKSFLESALQQGRVQHAEATVAGFLLIAFLSTLGLSGGCALCRIMDQDKLLIEQGLKERVLRDTCEKLPPSPEGPKEWEAELRAEDKYKLVDILAEQAVNSAEPKAFFDDMILNAELPPRFRQLGVGRFGGPAAAQNFVAWALNQGRNPLKPSQLTIASLIAPKLEDFGLEKATWIIALFISNNWVSETETGKLRRQFGVPEIGAKSSEFVEIGPDFAWRGSQSEVELQGFLRPTPIGLDVGFITEAANASRTVCRIEDERQSPLGTGFLIRPGVLVTCFHVFGRNEAEVRVNFSRGRLRFRETSAATFSSSNVVVDLASSSILAMSEATLADFILLRIEGAGSLSEVVRSVSSTQHRVGDNINILHHPRGMAMQLNLSPTGVTWGDEQRVQYLCNTAVGSSGAPCYDDSWNIVGVHHALRSRAFGISGEGIPISSVLKALELIS